MNSGNHSNHTNLSSLDAAEVREQVIRICQNPSFAKSRILSDFLNFVIEKTLDGKQNILKEYTIALEVLKKKPDFNPQLDAIVRIHAGRLRKILDAYYDGEGANDPVKIQIPRGSYVPIFEKTPKKEKLANPARVEYEPSDRKPKLGVLPFTNFSNEERLDVISFVLSKDITVELTKFNELGIIGTNSTHYVIDKLSEQKDIAAHLGVEYLITGSCLKLGNRLKVTVELHDTNDGVDIWADSFTFPDEENEVFENIAYIIRKIVNVVASHCGILYRHIINSPTAAITKDYSYAYAIYMFNQYHLKYNSESLTEAMHLLKIAVEKHPDNTMLNTILGGCIVNLASVDFKGNFDPLELGEQYLNKALKLDPNNQYAYKDVAWLYILKHDKSSFLQAINTALSINPNNATITGDAGFGYICVGEYEKGMEFLLESIELNPYFNWYYNLAFTFYYFQQHDFEEAFFNACRINRPEFYWDPILRASALAWLGRLEEARPILKEILAIFPDFEERPMEILGILVLDTEVKQTILTGLIKAGIKVDNVPDSDEDNKIIKILRVSQKSIG